MTLPDQNVARPYDDEYTAAVQIAARAIHASDVEYAATLQVEFPPLPDEFDDLDDEDRAFYLRAAGIALTVVWERGWTRRAALDDFQKDRRTDV